MAYKETEIHSLKSQSKLDIEQRSPISGQQISTSRWSVGNWEVGGGLASEDSSVFAVTLQYKHHVSSISDHQALASHSTSP